jgi:hypothetical protein
VSTPATLANAPPAKSGELDALLCAISEAIDALVEWNIPGFQSAVERQSAICESLALKQEWRALPGAAATARRVQDLNRVYDRLLQHSIHWTRVIHATLQATGGNPYPRRASVHFRG